MITKPKRNKFGAKPTIVDGIRFASKAEATRYMDLKLLEKAGHISGLKLQPSFLLTAADEFGNTFDIGHYVADFEYLDETGARVVEDVKGGRATQTPLFKWKREHFEAQYGIPVSLVDGKGRAA